MSVIGQAEGIEHGTVKGYKQHTYRQIKPCDDCKRALREDRAAVRRGERPKQTGQTEKVVRRPSSKKQAHTQVQEAVPVRLMPPPPAPFTDRSRLGVPVQGHELAIGDVIVFLGNHHRIDRFEPYTGSLLAELGEGTRVACAGAWGMTVGPRSTVRILPRPAGGERREPV
ncbi:hypothetical protein [Streptosporangium carneum]|nr:hypothetical protein [Streptosporangium carneum]